MLLIVPSQSLFVIAVIGLLAGAAARRVVGRRGTTFGSLALGLAGSFIGTIVGAFLGLPIASAGAVVVVALTGATALLALAALVQRR